MNCPNCNRDLQPAYTPCPQCKRRAGYCLVEDNQQRTELWNLAAKLMNSDFSLTSPHSEPSLASITERKWWISGHEGCLQGNDFAGIEAACASQQIDKLVGIHIERISEPAPTFQEVTYAAIVDATAAALQNYSLDFPISFVLFPQSCQLLIYQHNIEATLIAGSKVTVETVLGVSIEQSLTDFRDEMKSAGTAELAQHYLDTLIHPANTQAKQHYRP